MRSIKKKIDKLRKKILKYEYYYHTLDQPIISDAEYDYLLNQLYNLELKNEDFITSDSPTQKVGSKLSNKFKKIIHFFPMLSLDNTFDLNGYLDFEKKIKKSLNTNDPLPLCCELKIDGIAVSIIYEEGIFTRASTRGDGYKGENVTSNVRMIKSIPLKIKGSYIPKRLEIRGEVFMLRSDFIKLNIESKINKTKLFSNPRNAAAGSLRHIDSKITSERKLMFFCYGCYFFEETNKFSTHYERLMQCLEWKIPVNKEIITCSSYKEVWSFYKKFENKRKFLDFDIDGIVVKVNSLKLQNQLGLNLKSPKWAIALKFISAERITKLNEVKFQVGRTGVITPVAYFDPVDISGVIIKKASLHSKSEIERLNLCINDFIVICRAGDVIPKILSVVKHSLDNRREKVLFPLFCPVCKTKLLENKEEKIIRCHSGLTCNAQKKKALYHFFSKKSLNVNGLSLKIVNELINRGYVENVIDFFSLTNIELSQLKNVGSIKSAKIINDINQCKKTTFKRFIHALGIPKVGEGVSEKIANYFITIDKLMSSDREVLNNIDGIGKVISNNIFNYFSTISNRNMIMQLIQEIGVFWSNQDMVWKNSQKTYFFGKKIVLTGVLTDFSRAKLKDVLINLGATILNSVSKNVDILICGKNFGSKFYKAKELNIEIINEKKLKVLI